MKNSYRYINIKLLNKTLKRRSIVTAHIYRLVGLQVFVKNMSIFAWLGFICAHKSHYADYIATEKQLFIEKSEKINIFDISICQKVKYRNIDIEKIPVFIDILQQPSFNLLKGGVTLGLPPLTYRREPPLNEGKELPFTWGREPSFTSRGYPSYLGKGVFSYLGKGVFSYLGKRVTPYF